MFRNEGPKALGTTVISLIATPTRCPDFLNPGLRNIIRVMMRRTELGTRMGNVIMHTKRKSKISKEGKHLIHIGVYFRLKLNLVWEV